MLNASFTTYYKVVQYDLTSFCHNPEFPEKFRVKYKIGEWVQPPIGKLFIFGSLDEVKKFVLLSAVRYRIFTCEAENVEVGKHVTYDFKRLVEFWTSGVDVMTAGAPSGTLYADRVKLIKEVK